MMNELAGGAKINRIFHERLPYELIKAVNNTCQLCQDISLVILSALGVRTGLAPEIVFNIITRRQIKKLLPPALKCVDLATNEVIGIVKSTADGMNRYPLLRDETERILTTFLREQEQKAKDHITLMVSIELSYMNTNHPDFVGFDAAAKGASGRKKDRSIGNQVIRKGWLCVAASRLKVSREYWFILTSESLTWYRDAEEKEQKYSLRLEDMKIKDIEVEQFSEKFVFVIYNMTGMNVYKDQDQLQLIAQSEEEVESWKASFLRAGVYPEAEKFFTFSPSVSAYYPQLEHQVETIRNPVESYIDIVIKTMKDQVPKTIMFMIVNKLKDYIHQDLLPMIYAAGDQNSLMEESKDAATRREEIIKMYHACKEALHPVQDVNLIKDRDTKT